MAVRKDEYYVYVIKCKGVNIAKIGCTYDVKKRLKQIQTYTPYEVFLSMKFAVQNPFRLEDILHQSFSKKRMKGEWFNLVHNKDNIYKCDLFRLHAIVHWYQTQEIDQLTKDEWIDIINYWKTRRDKHYKQYIKAYKRYEIGRR